jgi:hypothetical protein
MEGSADILPTPQNCKESNPELQKGVEESANPAESFSFFLCNDEIAFFQIPE